MGMTAGARALRAGHVLIAAAEVSCLGYLWFCAVTNRRDRALWAAIAVLIGEGVGLVIGHGDCPLGPLQQRLGDPVPLFELVLPPRAAKAAVPVLAGTTGAGLVVVAVRSRGDGHRYRQRRSGSDQAGDCAPESSKIRRQGAILRHHAPRGPVGLP